VPGDVRQFRQLGHEDQDGQRVDETGNHRTRDKAHQRTQAQVAGADLQQAAEQRRRQQVLQAVLAHQRHHQQCHGAGGGRDHTRAAADEGDHHGDTEGGVEADPRIDPGDDGEGDGFGNQRQRDDEAGQHIATDVGEPVLFDRLQHRTIQSKSTTMQTTGGRQRYKASFLV